MLKHFEKIAGFLIVTFAVIPPVQAARILVRHHTPIATALTLGNAAPFEVIESGEAEMTDTLQRLNQDPNVAYAEPDYALMPSTLSNDTLFSTSMNLFYNFRMSHVFEAWDMSSDCRNVLVAVLDTGIDRFHPDLEENLWFNANEIAGNGIDDDANGYVDDDHGYDFAANTNDVSDVIGHGTQVAGIIGAVGNNDLGLSGVCRSVQMLNLKIFGADHVGHVSSFVKAIDYAIEAKAVIINMSWDLEPGIRSQFLQEAILKAKDHGVLVVVSAGNNGMDLTTSPLYPPSYRLSNMISVGSVGMDGERSSFSNFGEGIVDLAAPGNNIYTTAREGSYGFQTGTSAAAPQVAGIAALLLSRDAELSPEQIIAYLKESASPSGESSSPPLVNAWEALKALDGDMHPLAAKSDLDTNVSNINSGGCALIPQ